MLFFYTWKIVRSKVKVWSFEPKALFFRNIFWHKHFWKQFLDLILFSSIFWFFKKSFARKDLWSLKGEYRFNLLSCVNKTLLVPKFISGILLKFHWIQQLQVTVPSYFQKSNTCHTKRQEISQIYLSGIFFTETWSNQIQNLNNCHFFTSFFLSANILNLWKKPFDGTITIDSIVGFPVPSKLQNHFFRVVSIRLPKDGHSNNVYFNPFTW